MWWSLFVDEDFGGIEALGKCGHFTECDQALVLAFQENLSAVTFLKSDAFSHFHTKSIHWQESSEHHSLEKYL